MLNALWSLSSTSRDPSATVEARCISLLRRYPFWEIGHKALAEIALSQDDVARAYASATCYRVLCEGSGKDPSDALYILGQCFLRRGDCAAALTHLERAHALDPARTDIQEELAAAHVLAGDYGRARAVLENISAERISAEGKAALAFVRSRPARQE